MPELPEVETTRRGIEPWARGQTITGIEVRNPSLRWPVEAPDVLLGQRIDAVNRRGKYLLFHSSAGHLIVHLGMSGSLRVVSQDTALLKHDHFDLRLSVDARQGAKDQFLRLNDPRRFGCVLFHAGDNVDDHWLLKNLGVEPLSNDFHGDYLFARTRGRKVAIKNLIMDSKVVVGVGNIYAAEALFLAGIRPAVAAQRLTRAAAENLADAIKRVLSDAIRQGGTTLRDFVGSDGKPGYFKQRLNVYGRENKPCRVCECLLKLKTIGQRSSVYCPNCQTGQGFSPVV